METRSVPGASVGPLGERPKRQPRRDTAASTRYAYLRTGKAALGVGQARASRGAKPGLPAEMASRGAGTLARPGKVLHETSRARR
jgi:hypothetical protein